MGIIGGQLRINSLKHPTFGGFIWHFQVFDIALARGVISHVLYRHLKAVKSIPADIAERTRANKYEVDPGDNLTP